MLFQQRFNKEFIGYWLIDIQHRQDESRRARAPEPNGSVQARSPCHERTNFNKNQNACWHNCPRVDRVVADKAQTHCSRLERLVPWFFKTVVV